MNAADLKYTTTCANEAEHASVQKLSCRAVRQILAERQMLLEALRAVALVAGNLPDDTLTEKTGANDSVARGIMVCNARMIANSAIATAIT